MLILGSWSHLSAAHLVGGEITYRCLGYTNDDPSTNSRRYEFTINVFRDCFSGGSLFDSPSFAIQMHVTIFEGRQQFRRLELPGPDITAVNINPGSSCVVVPGNVCVEEGKYVFEVDLPISTEAYTISYQRCCRNNTITNIVDPGGSGSTYTIELTPEAQQSCNSTPIFREYPPAVLCTGQLFTYDFSAEDADGDLLVYEFCSPIVGGGANGGQGPADGVAPDPDLPPPYGTVRFFAPTYTATRPLGEDANLTLDASTGFMVGRPSFSGQFVVGVCVSEYRNGVLLSTVSRDFQFNVSNCEVTVFADIRSDSVSIDGDLIISSCGATEVTLDNNSGQAQFIDGFLWNFDFNGQPISSTNDNFTFDFEDVGQYRGQLVVNPNSPDCADTANVIVNIYPDLQSDFSFEYDTCVAGPVTFTNLSETLGGQAVDRYLWRFGDGNESLDLDPIHRYDIPGNFSVELIMRDENGCQDRRSQTIPYFPVPGLLLVSPSEFEGCVPASIFFDNLSTPIDETYTFEWDFGDGNSGSDLSPTHIYEEPGTFDVSLRVISPLGCETDTLFFDLITIEAAPTAGFDFFPDIFSNFEPEVTIVDQSEGAFRWFYDFGGESTSTVPEPMYSFRDTGITYIRQVVTHPSGCIDTLTKIIDIVPKTTFYFPNAFTPNGDGTNDLFVPKGFTRGYKSYDMRVWNRYGEPVFTTKNPIEGWNGRKNNVGRDQPPGIYLYEAVLIGPRGETFEYKGYATLLR